MMADVDLQNMTDTETADLAVRCLDSLILADKVQAVLKAFASDEDRQELMSWLESEKEDEEEDDE